jgi:hypothetical protein
MNRKRATQLRTTLRLEVVYGLILSCAANAQRGLNTYAGRYLIGNLRFIGSAGYDSLLVGFEIVDKRFLLHKSLLDLALNFSPTTLVSNLPRNAASN